MVEVILLKNYNNHKRGDVILIDDGRAISLRKDKTAIIKRYYNEKQDYFNYQNKMLDYDDLIVKK